MAKPGRNDPCPCGSSKKYKKCCLPQDEAAAAAARPPAPPPIPRRSTVFTPADWEYDRLDQDSNHVVDLIHAGQLDEAEAAARALLRDYPEVPDGLERLAATFEARGDAKQAASYYRQTAAFMDEHDGFDDEGKAWMRDKANKLDPPPA
jgi:tetratricopeptide (TPR) repeat protein